MIKRFLGVVMVCMLIFTAIPAYGADAKGRIAKVYFHVKSTGDDYSVVGRPSAENFPQYVSGDKDNELIEHRLYAYYYLETGIDEITGIAYYDASGTLGPKILLGQTEFSKYAGYIPFSVKKNAAAGSNVTGDLDDTMYVVERDANGNIISKTPIKPGPPVDEPAAWAKDPVAALKAWGKLDGAFFTNYQGKITRKDFAALSVALYEALKGEKAPVVTADMGKTFTDTADVSVLQGYALGLVNGYGNGKYGPADPITREQIAKLLVGACDKAGSTLAKADSSMVPFKDQNLIADWALPFVRSAYKNDIMKGTGPLQIAPKENTTREQALTLMYNILKSTGNI